MTDKVRFQVRGLPVPQGSTRTWIVNGKPVTTSAAKGLSGWRRLVADVAQGCAPPELWEGPVSVLLAFDLPKPKSVPRTKITPASWPAKRPDLDKLCRAVLDAITHVIIADDSQVVSLYATKEYGTPGVTIEVRKMDELFYAAVR